MNIDKLRQLTRRSAVFGHKITTVEIPLLILILNLVEAAEYQCANHPDDTVEWLTDAITALKAKP